MKRLQRQAGRSDSWFSWDLQRAEVLNAWLTFAFELDPNGLYSPLAHEELPHQFALLASADVQQALTFARTYGRLGWLELKVDDSKHNPWRRGAEQRHSRLYRECGTDAHFAEPLLWIVTHSRGVRWCLQAAHALRLSGPTKQNRCQELVHEFPEQYGNRATIDDTLRLARSVPAVFAVADGLAALLQDNLIGVRRRIRYDATASLQSTWSGTSLLECIYTIIADSLTGRTLAQCELCSSIFIRTDERQRYCPPRQGQAKSSCMNRVRVGRQRSKGRSSHGKTSRKK